MIVKKTTKRQQHNTQKKNTTVVGKRQRIFGNIIHKNKTDNVMDKKQKDKKKTVGNIIYRKTDNIMTKKQKDKKINNC